MTRRLGSTLAIFLILNRSSSHLRLALPEWGSFLFGGRAYPSDNSSLVKHM